MEGVLGILLLFILFVVVVWLDHKANSHDVVLEFTKALEDGKITRQEWYDILYVAVHTILKDDKDDDN